MGRATASTIASPPAARNGDQQAHPRTRLAVKSLGAVFAVQDHRIVSLVRLAPTGEVVCDCGATPPCPHIRTVTARREAERDRPSGILVASEHIDGAIVQATQTDRQVAVMVGLSAGRRLQLRPHEIPGVLRALDRVGQILRGARR